MGMKEQATTCAGSVLSPVTEFLLKMIRELVLKIIIECRYLKIRLMEF